MALTTSQLAELVRKAKIHLRISDNDPDFLGDGITIYHDQSSSATAATAKVESDVLTLVVTGGSNAGTYTKDLTSAANDTLTELVTAVNDLNKGFVARLVGNSTAASTSIAPFDSTSVFGASNEKEVKVERNDLLELLIEEAYDSIVEECDRHFLDASYDERTVVSVDGVLVLKEPNISSVHFVGNTTQDAARIEYNGSDQHARVEVTDTSIKITSTNGATDTENEFTFSSGSYDTVSEVVDAITAVSGWTATLIQDDPSKFLIRQPSLYVKQAGTSQPQTIESWEAYDGDYTTHYEAGIIQLNEGGTLNIARVIYRAGLGDIPKAVERELFALVKGAYDGSKQNSAITSEKLGDYSYTTSKESVGGTMNINDAVRHRLSKYVRMMP